MRKIYPADIQSFVKHFFKYGNICRGRSHCSHYFGAIENRDGKFIATGSRAIAALGMANTITDAEKIAEAQIAKIHGKIFHRADIGTAALIAKRVQHMQELRS